MSSRETPPVPPLRERKRRHGRLRNAHPSSSLSAGKGKPSGEIILLFLPPRELPLQGEKRETSPPTKHALQRAASPPAAPLFPLLFSPAVATTPLAAQCAAAKRFIGLQPLLSAPHPEILSSGLLKGASALTLEGPVIPHLQWTLMQQQQQEFALLNAHTPLTRCLHQREAPHASPYCQHSHKEKELLLRRDRGGKMKTKLRRTERRRRRAEALKRRIGAFNPTNAQGHPDGAPEASGGPVGLGDVVIIP
ncbi:hypothetical protein cyc_06182 [Cyclospora cayetanensis]|uniref:Uncharacterized protein n=1 Tax=Cyclospora cayetanensis TaxID=88456 RepID=A0A1D3D7G0_9EIME|nr:hypothetical protein cyc_06182 [Cyclospora cayetanensis]